MLQELQHVMQQHGLPAEFVRVAAPTGSAAFNLRFNATTVHRLIHWFSPPYFSEFKRLDEHLHRFQEYLSSTQIIVLDEVSMIGRQMMGRIDSRFRQGKAEQSGGMDNLGGLSCVCVGDPAQCEAIRDQQIYDVAPHKDTAEGTAEGSSISEHRVYF